MSKGDKGFPRREKLQISSSRWWRLPFWLCSGGGSIEEVASMHFYYLFTKK